MAAHGFGAMQRRALLLLMAGVSPAQVQRPRPEGMSLAEAAERRFPQPVRVGDLLRRPVLQPLESQPTLGRVRDVVRLADGAILVVMDYGGFLGFFSRPIAVPVEGMALLGEYMVCVEFTPRELDAFQTFMPGSAAPLPAAEIIRVGLVKPSH
jgi:hypothetical protein